MTMSGTKDAPMNRVPSSFKQLCTVMKYTLLDYVRSRRFVILLTISLLISAFLTVVVGYYRPATFLSSALSFYSGWWGSIATFVIILSGIFFGGDAISGEFQNKTGYFGIPNPIKRSTIYLGKLLSAFVASTIILLVFAAITMGNGMYYFSNVPMEFWMSFAFALVYLAAVLGFTFLFSSFFRSSTMAILVTAIVFLFAFNIIQTFVANYAQIEPWFILTYGAQIIGNVLSNPYPAHIQTISFGQGAFSYTIFNAPIVEGLVIMIAYFAATAILGLFLFGRKEFN
jgi:ABC-2 type transport system permease protein